MNNEELIRRYAAANAVLENPVFIEAVSAVRATYINQMMASDPHDSRARDLAHSHYTAINAVVSELESFMADGERAEAELERLRSTHGNQR